MRQSRHAAIAAGERQYDTKKPCIHGHYSPRLTIGGICLACKRIISRLERQRVREALDAADAKKKEVDAGEN